MAEPSRRRALDLLVQHTFSGTTDPQIAGCAADEEPCTCGLPVSDWTGHYVDVLAVAGLLVDPGVDQSASWVLGRVREALGTPNGRAVSVHAAEVRAARDLALWLHAEAKFFGDGWHRQWMSTRETVRKLQARIADVLAWLEDADGMELTRVGIDGLRAKLQGAQPAEPEARCMNGPAKQHTLRMVAVIKALKAAAVNGQLPATAEPLPFAKIARAIVDNWPRDFAEPERPKTTDAYCGEAAYWLEGDDEIFTPVEPDVTPPDPSGRITDHGPVEPFTAADLADLTPTHGEVVAGD